MSPWTIFTALSIVDILIPALIRISYPEFNVYPPWMEKLYPEDLLNAVVITFFGWCLFTIGYINAKKMSITKYNNMEFIPRRAFLLLLINLVFYFFYFVVILNYYGGFSAYVTISLTDRFKSDLELPHLISTLNLIRPLSLTLIFILVAKLFYFSNQERKDRKKVILLPVIGFLLALTTFFRGTILNYLFGFISLGFYKNNVLNASKEAIARSNKRNVKLIVFIVAAFLTIGALRGFFIQKEFGNSSEISLVKEINKNLTGSALIGLSSIVKNYGKTTDYLYGETIIDMLLMPVPRSIYPSKPAWYGIDDITRGMGWPKSTQSAVSPQGEYYANFGLWGGLLMYFLGAFFGCCRKLAEKNLLYFSLYAFIIVPVTLTTFWMSTTGLINGIKMIPFIFLILKLLYRKNKV